MFRAELHGCGGHATVTAVRARERVEKPPVAEDAISRVARRPIAKGRTH